MSAQEQLGIDANQVLTEVATSTLEDWAMMLTENSAIDDLNKEALSNGYITRLNLKGPVTGEIHIIATKEFANLLHQNLSGDFESIAIEDDIMDCLREMTNITAGRIVTEVFGEDAVFDLTELSCSGAKEGDLENAIKTKTSILLLGDDCPVCFSLKF